MKAVQKHMYLPLGTLCLLVMRNGSVRPTTVPSSEAQVSPLLHAKVPEHIKLICSWMVQSTCSEFNYSPNSTSNLILLILNEKYTYVPVTQWDDIHIALEAWNLHIIFHSPQLNIEIFMSSDFFIAISNVTKIWIKQIRRRKKRAVGTCYWHDLSMRTEVLKLCDI